MRVFLSSDGVLMFCLYIYFAQTRLDGQICDTSCTARCMFDDCVPVVLFVHFLTRIPTRNVPYVFHSLVQNTIHSYLPFINDDLVISCAWNNAAIYIHT